jgi:hypothetical protein
MRNNDLGQAKFLSSLVRRKTLKDVIATYVNPEIQDIQAKTPEIFLAFFL